MLSNLIRLATKTWVIAAVTVIICACFVAKAVGSIIAAETLTEETTSKVPPAPPRPIVATRTKLDGKKIDRNIFCSTCEPTVVVAGPDKYTGEPAVLIATMIGPDPRATVRVLASEAQGSWGIGERIPGVGMIDRIGSTSIDVVDVSGHRGTISMFENGQGQPKNPPDSAKSDPAAPANPFADRIKKVADNDFEVDRTLVRELVSAGAKPGQPRVFPQMKDGEITGLKLTGVRPDSVAGALSLKNSDIIQTLDGEPIKNIQQLLDFYAKLEQVTAVEIGGTRAGKPLKLTLRLR